MKSQIVIAASLFALAGCTPPAPPSAERRATAETDRLQAEAHSQIGLPRINNFTEKRLATKLSELRDKPNLLTYAYVQGMDGMLRCFGKGVGFGIPYATQITNPSKVEDLCSSSYCPEVLPQAEPNGLYMPESASATWYMLIDPKSGEASPVYVEPNLTVSTKPLTGPAVAAPCAA
jgi:hypothetical protein